MASNRGMGQNIVMRRGGAVGDIRISVGRVGDKLTLGLEAVLVG